MCQGDDKRATHAPRLPSLPWQHALPHSNMLLPPLATLLPSNEQQQQQHEERNATWLAVSVQASLPPTATRRATHMPIGPLRVHGPNVHSQSAEPEGRGSSASHSPSASLFCAFGSVCFGCTSSAVRLQFGSVRVSSALLLGARACLGCLALWRLALPLPLPLSLALSLPLLLGESMPALTAPLTLQFNLKRLRVRYVLQRQRQRLCVTVTATATVTVTAIL